MSDSRIHPVGRLTSNANGTSFDFRYLSNVKSLERFTPLPGFPEIDRVYTSATLFPLFEVRIMSRRRNDYPEYVESLGLGVDDIDPFVLLARSEGWKSTDRIEVFAPPMRLPGTDTGVAHFFLRGLRHHPGAEERVEALSLGQQLAIRHEPDNPANPLAIEVLDDGFRLGHVPDYLVDHIHEVWDACGPGSVTVTVDHLNPDSSGSHMRVLCRLESCWPDGYEPFSDGKFQPIVT